jgi:hypothetical protein
MFPKNIKYLLLPRDGFKSMDELRSNYPALEMLHFAPPWDCRRITPAAPYISLRQVGLEFRTFADQPNASPERLEPIEATLKALSDQEAFPSLSVISCFTFLSAINDKWRQEMDRKFGRPGLRVEDENGNLLFLPQTKSRHS